MHNFLRNHGMNVKIRGFSIMLCELSRTTVQQKCGVAFLHSWLYTIGGFLPTPLWHALPYHHIQSDFNWNLLFHRSLLCRRHWHVSNIALGCNQLLKIWYRQRHLCGNWRVFSFSWKIWIRTLYNDIVLGLKLGTTILWYMTEFHRQNHPWSLNKYLRMIFQDEGGFDCTPLFHVVKARTMSHRLT